MMYLSATSTLEGGLAGSLHATTSPGSSELLLLRTSSQGGLIVLLGSISNILVIADVGRLLLLSSTLSGTLLGQLCLADLAHVGVRLGLVALRADALKDAHGIDRVLDGLGAGQEDQLDGPEGQTGNNQILGLGRVDVVKSQFDLLAVLVDSIHGTLNLLQGGDSLGCQGSRTTLTSSNRSLKGLLLLLTNHLLVLVNHSRHAFPLLNIADITSQVLESRGEDEQEDDHGLETGAVTSVEVGGSTPAGDAVLEEEVVSVTLAVVTQDRDDA